MAEPTGALTFNDLILVAALRLGTAYYGSDGISAPAIPSDAHDLAVAKGYVNDAIRMFIAAAPPAGWRWLRPTADLVIWPTVDEDADNKVTASAYDSSNGVTTLTVSTAAFYPSMELHSIVIDTIGTFVIAEYVSATSVKVTGDASATGGAPGKLWSMTADGNYTLPITFGGQYTGDITYSADTNNSGAIEWTSEAEIRRWRVDAGTESGDPYLAAVRLMATGSPRRRWELMVHPIPDEVYTLQFPYHLYFTELTSGTQVHPAPYHHDETVRAAVRAIIEREETGTLGPDTAYYEQKCLPNSYRADAHSAPRKLGKFGGPAMGNSRILGSRRRDDVTFNP